MLLPQIDDADDDVVMCRDCGNTVRNGGHSVAFPITTGLFSAIYCTRCAQWRSAHGMLFDPRLRDSLRRMNHP